MNELKFDLSAMIQPKNDRDIAAMLREALAELRLINQHFEQMSQVNAVAEAHA